MRGSPIKLTLNRSDLGVAVVDSTAAVWSSIVIVTVPALVAYVLLNHTPFVVKLADSGNTALTRNGQIIIGKKGGGDTLVKELHKFDYGSFYDLTIANQRNKNYAGQVSISMPWPYVIFRPDEQLILQVLHATACDISQTNNTVEFNVNKVVLKR